MRDCLMRDCLIEQMNKKELTLQEKKDIHEKWIRCGLLRGIEDAYVEECAVALETQRIYNEVSPDIGYMAQMKRISIPIIRRVFEKLLKNDLDVKAEGKIYSQWLKVDFVFGDFRRRMKNIWSQHNLDEEAEMCAKMCEEITEELTWRARMNSSGGLSWASKIIYLGPFTCDLSGQSYINYDLSTTIGHDEQ